jgi:type I restriction enzyme S subunit
MKTTELGNIINISKGKKVDQIFPTNGLAKTSKRYIQIDDLRNDSYIKYTDSKGVEVNENDLIIAWDGANAGTIGHNLKGVIGSTLARLRISDSNFDSKFLAKYLQSKFTYLRTRCTGATIPHISRSVLEKLKIPTFSLPEQKRIAELLDKADSIRQKRKESIALLDEFLRSVFLDMFGDPVRNEKGWEKKTLKSIVEDYDYGLSDKADEDASGIPMLRMNNITYGGRIDLTNLKYINKNKFNINKYLLNKDDFLFNRTNSPELVGKCSVWDSDEEYTYAGYLIRFKFSKSLATSLYVSHYFNSKYGKKYLFEKARPSNNMSNISASTLMGLNILVPPINLQTHFARIVEQVEVTKAKMEESLREMDRQFEGLMGRAFGNNK